MSRNTVKRRREKIVCIYSITNKVNGKVYIGSTYNYYNRVTNHKHKLNNSKHHSRHLQAAWVKYREDNFIFSVEEIVEDKLFLRAREQFWIWRTDCKNPNKGYNSIDIAYENSGSYRGGDIAKKISKALKGRKLSPENAEKLHASTRGKPLTAEHKKKISESNKGKKLSEEAKIKIGLAHRGKTITDSLRAKYSQITTGSGNPRTKLTEDVVREIKVKARDGAIRRNLAIEYNISRTALDAMLNGQNWKHVVI